MGLLGKLLLTIGKWVEDSDAKYSTYEPKHEGKWVNRGTVQRENWQWVEKSKFIPVIINVQQVGEDYILIVSTRESGKAIDTMKCESQRQLDASLQILEQFYSHYGNVYITKEANE